MGRAKLAMEYIKKDKARNITFEKRKKGLKKKAYELATLCDVPVCVVIYQSPNSEAETFPPNHDKVRAIIDRYVSVPREDNAKRTLNLQDILEGKKRKAEQDLSKHQRKPLINATNKPHDHCYYSYPTWLPSLDGLGREDLIRLVSVLDYKLHAVEEKIGKLRGNFGNYFGGIGNASASNIAEGDDQIGGFDGLGVDHGMQWPLCVWQPSPVKQQLAAIAARMGGPGSFDPSVCEIGGGGGGSSGGVGGAIGGRFDPNVLMGPNFSYGQVDPNGGLAENAGFGGGAGGCVVSQPPSAVYNGSAKFEPNQMSGDNLGLPKWYEEGRFLF